MKQECDFISKKFIVVILFLLSSQAFAQAEDPDGFSSSPHTRYGEFNEEEDEANASLFFQYGRFFGVSVGGGIHGATGNRGVLYQGGFPLVDFKVHYWFDFQFSLTLNFFLTSHFYEDDGQTTDVNITNLGVDLKYYFDVTDATAAISFANPYLMIGVGSYSKSESTPQADATGSQGAIGFNTGAGLEFIISPKKIYFFFEGKVHFVNYEDRFNQIGNIPDLTGLFYSASGGFLFTW